MQPAAVAVSAPPAMRWHDRSPPAAAAAAAARKQHPL